MHDYNIKFDLENPSHCYMLGFFWADCYFGFNKVLKIFNFSFEIKHNDFLEIWPILENIGFTKFKTRQRKNSKIQQSGIRAAKKEHMEFFQKYNFHNKNEGCPLYFDLENNNRLFFIKGFLDGDGSISIDKNKLFRVSFNGNKNQSWDFLEHFCEKNNIKFSIYRKDRISKHPSHKIETHGYSVFEFTDLQTRINFCKLLENINTGVSRKINVFKNYKQNRLIEQEKSVFMKKLTF